MISVQKLAKITVEGAGHTVMKWHKRNRTAIEGVLFLESVVNDHGSIFRPVHQETDIGVDGHIELVHADKATGTLVAVQVKSGDSYLADDASEFSVNVDQAHLDYWCSYIVPVVLVCYSPSKKIAAWTPIRDYVEHERYHGRTPVASIRVPLDREFNVRALDEGVTGLATAHTDRRILIECVDKCLDGDSVQRFQGLSILAAHPDSRDSRTTAFIARRLLFDRDMSVSDEAIRRLAYHVGRFRWSWNPNNVDEHALISYSSDLCRDFTPAECRRLIERIDDEWFGGPDAMGERVFDLLVCCEESQRVMDEVARDKGQPMQRRTKALYMMYGCDDADLHDCRDLADDPSLGDAYRAMYADELASSE